MVYHITVKQRVESITYNKQYNAITVCVFFLNN